MKGCIDTHSIPIYHSGMKVNKGITIRISPSSQQRELLAKHFGHNRFLWNYFLSKRRNEYQEIKKGSTYNKDAAFLTKLRASPDHSWLQEVSVASQQRALKNLDDAYKRFFKKHSGFPSFKSKKQRQSFTVSGGVKIRDGKLCLPKFQDGIQFNRAIPPFNKINNITIYKAASGKYYASLSVEAEAQEKPITANVAGVDLGLKDFAVLSTGKRIKSPKFYVESQKELKTASQHLARKKKGSKRREKQRIKVARIHEKIANSRKDFLHKSSAYVINNFDTIVIEDLNIKGMVKNHSLAKHISDSGWSTFTQFLEYKAKWYGRELIKVGRFYPSSKTCNGCGYINQSLKLDQRTWTCAGCGSKHDRDLNASLNILSEGIKQKSERQSSITGVEAA